jgi:phospholipid transport system substrate-binding protein
MIYKKITKIFLILISLNLFTGHALAKKPSLTPEQTVKELLDSIHQIKKGKELSKKQIEINQVSSQKALGLMDLEKVSQKTLGKYWNARTPEEQKSFISLLSQVFVKIAFPSSSQFFANLKMKFLNNEVEEGKALVPISITSPEQGEINIDFSLRLNKGNWQIVDVILDGVSMRNNLRSQFKKVIRSKGYPELVERMKKKINES